MTCCQRIGAGPRGNGTGERQVASRPHKLYLIHQPQGGVFDCNPAKELGQG